MNYGESTQKVHWVFSVARLQQLQRDAWATSVAALLHRLHADEEQGGRGEGTQALLQVRQQWLAGGTADMPGDLLRWEASILAAGVPGIHDIQLLLRYYLEQMCRVCRAANLPDRVLSSGVTFFRRFYLHQTPMDYHPGELFLPCIVLAAKVEEVNVNLESFCSKLGVSDQHVLEYEVPLLRHLRFHLVVFDPFAVIASILGEFEKGEECELPARVRDLTRRGGELALFSPLMFALNPATFALAVLLWACQNDEVQGVAALSKLPTYLRSSDLYPAKSLQLAERAVGEIRAADAVVCSEEARRRINERLKPFVNPLNVVSSEAFRLEKWRRLEARDRLKLSRSQSDATSSGSIVLD